MSANIVTRYKIIDTHGNIIAIVDRISEAFAIRDASESVLLIFAI